MQRKRRPLWALVLTIYAIGAAALGAGSAVASHRFGREC